MCLFRNRTVLIELVDFRIEVKQVLPSCDLLVLLVAFLDCTGARSFFSSALRRVTSFTALTTYKERKSFYSFGTLLLVYGKLGVVSYCL